MECLAIFLLLVVGFIAAVASIGNRLSHRRGRRRMFQQLANQFVGAYDGGGLFSHPSVRLRYGETAAIVRECRTVGPFPGPGLEVRVAWPHTHIQGEIISQLGQQAEQGLLWPQLSQQADEFGNRFIVSGSDAADIGQLLTSGVQWQIERLRRLGDDERLYVLIRDGQIVVQKYWKRPRGPEPCHFVQGVLELYDQCVLAKASGIEFLHNEEAQTLERVICMICGESIVDCLVYCQRCKTPHHQECWHYTGVCSVFGCRETVYLMPQSGHASQLPAAEDRPVKKPR